MVNRITFHDLFVTFRTFFFRQAFISFNNIKNDEISLIGGEIYHSVLMKLATDGRTKQPLAKTKQIIKKTNITMKTVPTNQSLI